MKKLTVTLLALTMSGAVFAKLPAPSPEAKAKADEAKNKTAWGDKVAAYKLCKAQDKVAAQYLKTNGAGKKPMETPACADPGPYVPLQTADAAKTEPPKAEPAKK
jgi:hypothetical protein